MFPIRTSVIYASPASTRQAAYRALHTSHIAVASIKVGAALPPAELFEGTPENKVDIRELTAKKKVVLIAVPGAFAPGCSKIHLPGYVKRAEAMKTAGIDEIVCVSVNDPYVLTAWGSQQKTAGKIRMLADPCGTFIKAMDLGTKMKPLGGYRAKRFSMIVNDGRIEQLNLERDGTGLTCSLADELRYKEEDSKLNQT